MIRALAALLLALSVHTAPLSDAFDIPREGKATLQRRFSPGDPAPSFYSHPPNHFAKRSLESGGIGDAFTTVKSLERRHIDAGFGAAFASTLSLGKRGLKSVHGDAEGNETALDRRGFRVIGGPGVGTRQTGRLTRRGFRVIGGPGVGTRQTGRLVRRQAGSAGIGTAFTTDH